jgi:SAM-dependent methyltransferase
VSSRGQVEAWNEHYESGNIMLIPDIRVIRWAKNAQRTMFDGKPLCRNLRVLELGCGNGRHAVELARMGFPVVAVDYSPAAVNATRTWGAIERLGRKLQAFEVDLTNDKERTQFCMAMAVESFDLVLCWGVMEYFDGETVRRILEDVGIICRRGARMLIMARGPRDFCYDHAERSDGFMELHERGGDDWMRLMVTQDRWGDSISIDSRIESFADMDVGGVRGEKVEHMIFVEAELVE